MLIVEALLCSSVDIHVYHVYTLECLIGLVRAKFDIKFCTLSPSSNITPWPINNAYFRLTHLSTKDSFLLLLFKSGRSTQRTEFDRHNLPRDRVSLNNSMYMVTGPHMSWTEVMRLPNFRPWYDDLLVYQQIISNQMQTSCSKYCKARLFPCWLSWDYWRNKISAQAMASGEEEIWQTVTYCTVCWSGSLGSMLQHNPLLTLWTSNHFTEHLILPNEKLTSSKLPLSPWGLRSHSRLSIGV